MGIIGSLRVSNFSLIWVTDSPFLSLLLGWLPPFLYFTVVVSTHLATFKNITQRKPPLCGYFRADLGIPANKINGLTRVG